MKQPAQIAADQPRPREDEQCRNESSAARSLNNRDWSSEDALSFALLVFLVSLRDS
jgi:hypothetical protein